MSAATKLLKAAAGNAGGAAVYVDDVFSTFLYSGTGSSLNIVTGIDLSGEGGLVWTKSRTSAVSNQLTDTVSGYRLESDDTYAGEASQGNVTFNSNGHTQASGSNFFNDSGNDFVNWTFRKQPGFFDIVTYTGSGSNRTISHNLGSVPGVMIVKRTSASEGWQVYHRDLATNEYLELNSTNAKSSSNGTLRWNSTRPTATEFSLGTHDSVNANGSTYVAYLFAHDAQDFGTDSDEAIIKCGSYTGNGDSGVVEIDLGFEPQWVLIKSATGSGSGANWHIIDTMRGIPANFIGSLSGKAYYLRANASDAEDNSSYYGWIRNNGFAAYESNISNSGTPYIYVAIRRPHKPASEFAATDLFAVDTLGSTGDGKEPGYRSGFPVDMGTRIQPSSSAYRLIGARLTQGLGMNTNNTEVEGASGTHVFDYNNGRDDDTSTDSGKMSHMWRRAPGFFDVMTYKGTGSFTWLNHNLGVVPEMIWFKGRDIAENWNVFTTGQGTSSRLRLNDGDEALTADQNQFWTNLPTATQFRVGSNSEINGSGYNYIAYLFASADGISKLGTYAGTGSAQNIDCGFSAGARFVLIKRVDQAGFWILFDSSRGIVAGNDPYLFLNNYAAQVTNTDYIDPLSSGFTITSSAPTDNSDASMNKSGATYFFYAIA